MTKCDHNSCMTDGFGKLVPEDKRNDATVTIHGMPTDKVMFRCQKHLQAFDFLHQAVLAAEHRCVDKTVWKPMNVWYEKLTQ